MDYSSLTASDMGGLGALFGLTIGIIIFVSIISLAVTVLSIIGMWKMFTKAGKPGWAAIIPVYNLFVLLQVAKMDWWHLLIIVGLAILTSFDVSVLIILGSIGVIVYTFIIIIKTAKAFGKTTGFGVFTAFFPCIGYMILGCGSAKYQKD